MENLAYQSTRMGDGDKRRVFVDGRAAMYNVQKNSRLLTFARGDLIGYIYTRVLALYVS
jgi:hypothetical protein